MLFIAAVAIISFGVGFAMKRGGLCTYAAVLQIIHHQKFEKMLVFLGAAAWATLIIVPFSWIWTDWINLSRTHSYLMTSIMGGFVLGIGAFLNKGCFFGTFVQLVGGNLNYLATLLGLSVGTILSHIYLHHHIPEMLNLTQMAQPNTISLAWLLIMGVFGLFMIWGVRGGFAHSLTRSKLEWHKGFTIIILGVGGGLLYGAVHGWNYADVLANTTIAAINSEAESPSMIAIMSTVFMVAGGVVAAVTSQAFALKPARFFILISCFMGGTLMGAAALLVPGGNDGLLLKGIPSLAPHAIAGYASMVLTMLMFVFLFRRDSRSC